MARARAEAAAVAELGIDLDAAPDEVAGPEDEAVAGGSAVVLGALLVSAWPLGSVPAAF